MTTVTHEKGKPTPITTNPDEIRRDLLRPLPRLTFRLTATFLIVLAVFTWGMNGTDARPATFVEGVPNIIDFVGRLLPIEFEFEQGTERAYTFPGFQARVPEQLVATDRLRDLDPADTEALDNLGENQVVETLFRTEDRRFHLEPPADYEGELEEIPFIIESGQYLYIDPGSSDVYTLNEGERFVERFAIQEDQQLVDGRYLIQRGEIFVGWPVLIASIVETVQMALIGTAGAILLSIPFGLLAARNVSPHPVIYQVTRVLLNANRAIPELVYALIMVSAVGLGPFAGVLALIIGSIGAMGKLYAESIEAIDPQQVAAVRATGAGTLQVFNYSVIPQAFPMMASYSLLLFESNVRAATILGIVGAGGVGFIIQKYIQLFQYQKLMGAVVVIVIVVTLIDRASDYIRKKII